MFVRSCVSHFVWLTTQDMTSSRCKPNVSKSKITLPTKLIRQLLFTVRQQSCKKVMFSILSVYQSFCQSVWFQVNKFEHVRVWSHGGTSPSPASALSPTHIGGPAQTLPQTELFELVYLDWLISEWSDAIIEFSQKANSVTKIFVITVEGSNLPPLL